MTYRVLPIRFKNFG